METEFETERYVLVIYLGKAVKSYCITLFRYCSHRWWKPKTYLMQHWDKID